MSSFLFACAGFCLVPPLGVFGFGPEDFGLGHSVLVAAFCIGHNERKRDEKLKASL